MEEVAFVTREDGRVGFSPDGLLCNRTKVLELKNLKPRNHLAVWMNPEWLEKGYSGLRMKPHGVQVQFAMWASGGQIIEGDLLAHCPGEPPVLRTIWPDEDLFQQFESRTSLMIEKLDETLDKLKRADPFEGMPEAIRQEAESNPFL